MVRGNPAGEAAPSEWSSVVLQVFLERDHREDLECGELCGAGVVGAWLEVELGAGCVVWPKGYCIGFGTCGAAWFTQWRLEGSDCMGGGWILLREHKEEAGFMPGQVKAFPLTPTRYPLRRFRISPMHAAGENRCLHLYHFDVFGTLCELQAGIALEARLEPT